MLAILLLVFGALSPGSFDGWAPESFWLLFGLFVVADAVGDAKTAAERAAGELRRLAMAR